MKIFVTGGTGFTGAALVKQLLLDGHHVNVLDKNPGIATEELRTLGADVVLGSITNRDLVAQGSSNAEIVMHLAATFREVGVPDSVYRDVNVHGTTVVAEEAIKAGARKLIYCSTQGVHGNVKNPPGDETDPIAPADYYQQTKYEGELELEKLKNQIEYTILRPTAIYGPGDPERFYMIFKRANKGRFLMFGDGLTTYHPVYIDNLVQAFIKAMPAGVGSSEAYIIGDEQYHTLNDLVARVGNALGKQVSIHHLPILPLVIAGHVCEKACRPFGISPPIFPRRVDWFRQVRAFKIDKAKHDLGYAPEVGIDEGLRLTGEWYKAKGYL